MSVTGRLLRHWRDTRLDGPLPSWEDARSRSSRYDDAAILARVLEAALSVKRGDAAFERDSVAMPDPEVQWSILGALGIARGMASPLKVLDFGGSLGSLYFQHREILQLLDLKSWTVVEQDHFVEAGQEFMSDGTLEFQLDIECATSSELPTLAIFSSVLQYVPDYIRPLQQVLAAHIPVVSIDRTFLTSQRDARVFMQIVPPRIYKGSYPCWLIPKDDILGLFSDAGYDVIAQYENDAFPAVNKRGGTFGGFLAVRRGHHQLGSPNPQ